MHAYVVSFVRCLHGACSMLVNVMVSISECTDLVLGACYTIQLYAAAALQSPAAVKPDNQERNSSRTEH